MNPRLFILTLAIMTTACQVRVTHLKSRKICESVVDCEACLVLPDCYASFRPFKCLQYPVADQKTENGTLIVEHATCCPGSPSFDARICGFGAERTPYTEYLGYMAAAVMGTLMALMIGIGFCIYAWKKRRGSMNVRSPQLTSVTSTNPEGTPEVAEDPMNMTEVPHRGAQRAWNESLV